MYGFDCHKIMSSYLISAYVAVGLVKESTGEYDTGNWEGIGLIERKEKNLWQKFVSHHAF